MCYTIQVMIRHLLFDIDNTLYSASNVMEQKISERMFQFIADFLAVPLEEAIRLQKARRHNYGTTLEWLECEYHFNDRNAYFEAVHPASEISELQPDRNLRNFLVSLQLPMTVLTNAPMAHAERVLKFFNISDLFLGVFDISYNQGRGKPQPDAFIKPLTAVHKTAAETLFLDDYPAYVQGFAAIGGNSVLIDEKKRYPDFTQKSGIPSMKSIYELPPLLERLSAARDVRNR